MEKEVHTCVSKNLTSLGRPFLLLYVWNGNDGSVVGATYSRQREQHSRKIPHSTVTNRQKFELVRDSLSFVSLSPCIPAMECQYTSTRLCMLNSTLGLTDN